MAFTAITVTHQFLNPDGSYASGTVVFSLEKRMTNGTTSVVPGVTVTATLDGTGHLSASLYANTDTTTIPQDSQWRVDIRVNNEDDGPYFITIPPTPSTQDLGPLLPQGQRSG